MARKTVPKWVPGERTLSILSCADGMWADWRTNSMSRQRRYDAARGALWTDVRMAGTAFEPVRWLRHGEDVSDIMPGDYECRALSRMEDAFQRIAAASAALLETFQEMLDIDTRAGAA